MSIKGRVRFLQVVIAACILTVAATVAYAIRSADSHLKRVAYANDQLETITSLRVSANRFSEQIAELLLVGDPEQPDFESARAELEAGLDALEKITRGESSFPGGAGEREGESDELYRVQRMRALFRQINASVGEVLELDRQDRQPDAILMFRREIENRLDAEFENLLIAAALDEKEEVTRAEREAEALWQRVIWITAAVTGVAVLVSLVSGGLLTRSLTRPIGLLIEGTDAIGRGELGHRISHSSSDELGALARRFNEMAAVQEQQNRRLLGAQADLERQVAGRTRELAAANRRLKDLDRMRVQFLADISHELRTPLAGLRGEAEVTLRHGPKPEPVYRDTLARIVTYASDMSRLVEDLLFLARSETDTIRFDIRRLVLQDVVAAALRDGEALGRSRSVALRMRDGSASIPIEADAQRLRQAIVILLDNAVKYSLPNRVVDVSVLAESGAGEIVIRDEGVGIPAEELPHVFERFYRGRASVVGSPSGAGLGLSIAKWLVEKQGGTLAVESEEGRFTEFRLRMPEAKGTDVVENTAR